ncbi:MAG: FtsX-like permease family protein, partial [Fulvivirga sp.]
INLSIAQSFLRAKEVGIKKILGSSKWKVVRQFLTESFIVSLLATVLSGFLLYALLPLIITLLNLDVDLATFLKPELIIGAVSFIVLGVIITGYYPATLLSSFEPIKIVRGKFSASPAGNKWRHVLVIVQFSCALFLMICTVGIYQQISHMKSQNLGVNINNKVTFKAPIIRDSLYDDRIKTLLTELKTNTLIENFTSSSTVPGMPHEFKIGGVRRQNAGNEDVSHFGLTYIDQNFANVFDLEFIEGENLTEASEADVEAALINETAVYVLGFENAASAIGERVIIPRGVVTIKGVIRDFHNQSLKHDFEPSIYRLRNEGFKNHHTLSYPPDTKVSEVIQLVQELWNENYGADPLDLFMVDENYNNQYTTDLNFANLVLLFAMVAIVVTCLGLYSFTSLNLQNQQKDVAIKKVLGANILGLLLAFYKKYLKLLLLASVFSCPLAFYFLRGWLNGFAFRMSPGLELFLVPISIILILMIATISGIILKTTRTNPVTVIRSE